ncbi:hypothetical protein [Nannocystis pusilla]|uniref:Uncharacterized protein n=1 Tax=Nannocystis pusilla TaxID=889268 RepID=A0ABS7TK77_9BACT|nr:hypothetical protein [Nannocystis pusilla]MBZ5708622.1 hypothetical protein [Nannocystis pusilla]
MKHALLAGVLATTPAPGTGAPADEHTLETDGEVNGHRVRVHLAVSANPAVAEIEMRIDDLVVLASSDGTEAGSRSVIPDEVLESSELIATMFAALADESLVQALEEEQRGACGFTKWGLSAKV